MQAVISEMQAENEASLEQISQMLEKTQLCGVGSIGLQLVLTFPELLPEHLSGRYVDGVPIVEVVYTA